MVINKNLAIHNIIAKISYDNNLPNKLFYLVHKWKILEGDIKIVDAGLVDESLLQLYMLDDEDIVVENMEDTEKTNGCSEEEMDYLAKLWEMKLILDKL